MSIAARKQVAAKRFAFLGLALALAYLAPDSWALTAEQQAQALIGKEYGGLFEEGLRSSCSNERSEPLDIDDRPVPGWYVSHLWCLGKPVLALEESLGVEGGQPRARIADAIVLPPYDPGYGNTRPDVLMQLNSHNCTLDGKHDEFIIALARRGRHAPRASLLMEARYAWGFDIQRGKIVPISTRRIRCEYDDEP